MKKILVIMCGLMLVLGVVGNANAVRFDYTGLVTTAGTYFNFAVTGYFSYDPSATVTNATGVSPAGSVVNYLNVAQLFVQMDGLTFLDSAADVQTQNDRNGSQDKFQVGTILPLPSPLPANYFNLAFNNQSGSTILGNLLTSTLLPDELADLNILANRTQGTTPYSSLVGTYRNAMGTSDTYNFSFRVLDVTLHSDAAPVPEPATMLLLGSGLVGLAGIGRRKFFKK